MKIKIDQIKFNKDLYPRDELDDNVVERYRLSLDDLPPIVVSKDCTLIDGYHRLIANKIEGKSEIAVEFLDVNSENDILLEAIQRNSKHGKQLSKKEKKRLARTIYDGYYGEFTQKDIADLLSVSVNTVSSWCVDITDKKREARKQKILEMYLDYVNYPKQEDVAQALGVDRTTVSRHMQNFKSVFLHIDSLQLYNVWRFASSDTRYGIKYPGRIPGQILENLLYYYTNPFDLVADPMSGGGTTLDVCKAMYRRYACFDINPIESKGIVKNDIQNGIPLPDSGVKLVFLDPPYWNLMEEHYTERSISTLNYHDWLEAMSKIGDECYRILSNEGICALLIMGLEDERGDKRFKDAPIDSTNLFRAKGFEIIQRISVPINTEVKSSRDVIFAKENKKILSINRDLILFKKHE